MLAAAALVPLLTIAGVWYAYESKLACNPASVDRSVNVAALLTSFLTAVALATGAGGSALGVAAGRARRAGRISTLLAVVGMLASVVGILADDSRLVSAVAIGLTIALAGATVIAVVGLQFTSASESAASAKRKERR